MTSYHHGVLYLSDGFGNPVEVFNEARTAYNLQTSGLTQFSDIVSYAGCVGYDYAPCSMASDGSVTEWTALNLATNPWEGTTAASQEAIGFYIDEWTGLDSGHNTRAAYDLAGGHGGARFGQPSSSQRVMALNVTLIATSERGLTHLFRWMETMFAPPADGAPMSLWLRESCPGGTTEALLEEGFLRLDEIAMVASPTWIEPPLADSGCFIRRMTLTLSAGNPCMFAVPSAAATTTITTPAVTAVAGDGYEASCEEWSSIAVRAYAAVTAPLVGSISPIVTISSPLEVGSIVPMLRVYASIDDRSLGSLVPCRQRRAGTILVQGLPAGYEMTIDCSDGSSFVRDLYGEREWYDGAQFIGLNSVYAASYRGKRAISVPPCVNGYVVVEPALAGSTHFGTTAAIVSSWSVTIQTVTRFGCA